MKETPNIGLALSPSSEWNSTYYRDYILKMSGDDGTSNMQIIDKEIGDVVAVFASLETFLSTF